MKYELRDCLRLHPLEQVLQAFGQMYAGSSLRDASNSLFCGSHNNRCALLHGWFAICRQWVILASCVHAAILMCHFQLCVVCISVAFNANPQASWFYYADALVDLPSTQDVSVHVEDGPSYIVTLYSGRLDAKALKETLAEDGLFLTRLNGVVLAFDASGMSRTIFDTDILAKTQAKKGEACPS